MAANVMDEALTLLDSLRTVISAQNQEIPTLTPAMVRVTMPTGQPRQQQLLPSMFRARQSFTTCQSEKKPVAKRRKVCGNGSREKSFTKDILCIPPSDWTGNTIPIPRGKGRGRLVELGLAGKMMFWSSWSNERIVQEVTSLFGAVFGLEDGQHLPYRYLSVVAGMKKLAYPKVSATFQWTGTTVAALAGQGGLYIESYLPLVKEETIEIKGKVIDVDSDPSDGGSWITSNISNMPDIDKTPEELEKNSLESDASYSPVTCEDYFCSYAEILVENDVVDQEDWFARNTVLEISARDSISKPGDYKEILKKHGVA